MANWQETHADGLRILPVQALHVMRTYDLPMHHKNPFDRLVATQAQVEKMTIITSDKAIARYDVQVVW